MKLLNVVLVTVYMSSLCLSLPHEYRQENSPELPFLDINSFFSDKESIVLFLPTNEGNGDKQKLIRK